MVVFGWFAIDTRFKRKITASPMWTAQGYAEKLLIKCEVCAHESESGFRSTLQPFSFSKNIFIFKEHFQRSVDEEECSSMQDAGWRCVWVCRVCPSTPPPISAPTHLAAPFAAARRPKSACLGFFFYNLLLFQECRVH